MSLRASVSLRHGHAGASTASRTVVQRKQGRTQQL